MKKFFAVASAVVLLAGSASAEGWGNRSSNTNVAVAQSYSSSHSSSRAQGGSAVASNSGNTQTTNFRDRLQAPGFGVGGGYCSNGLSISFPGGGFGFSAMERMCKTEIGARVAKQYLNSQAAAQYVCSQYEFRNLTVCRPRR